jgi:3-oxoacyl-[acyl-carrier-protein] synthase II
VAGGTRVPYGGRRGESRGGGCDGVAGKARGGISAGAKASAGGATGSSEQSKGMSMVTKDGKKRVVVTGMGVVSAHGNDVDAFYTKLLAGESAITTISEW